MLPRMLLALHLAGTAAAAALLPVSRIAADFDPRPVITGGSTANLLFGKLQRAAQLPTTRLAKNPCAAVDDRGKLESLLWSSFAMSNLPAADALKRSELSTSRVLESGLLFLDALPAEAGGWLSGLPFGGGKKAVKDGEAPLLDLSALELAAARGAQHAFVLLKGDAAILECVTLLKSLPLCATLIAPEEGVTVASTPGWVCEPLQDHDGSLLGPLAVRDGWDAPASALLPSSAAAASRTGTGTTLAREDIAELAVQCALRLARTPAEGCPPLRVLRVSRGLGGLTDRPRNTYDAVIGGPKTRERLGRVSSADWSGLLGPFGVVRETDPTDWRLLTKTEPDEKWVPAPPAPKAE
ncbi:hypothetical protein Ctob_006320 [Chrysochromulina tobinii]|uniref:Uncharacterized protein n=1 Tax=Chrysochromulina tobinii TaxID=1460289 RepID=A0A0M0JU51_9EUKA|nr:hypothetical protein Ctob_006320 [Chrysochromulina tobinii]|eukprot:KOO30030.1 hypothetical protein Ctob_006320 [Chrysochromulina sp. CCMP291]